MRFLARASALAAVAFVGAAAFSSPVSAADKEPTRGLRFPSLTPDGKTVVFSWRGDIWRSPVAGGSATRLTIHEAQDTKPKVSPDGKWIAFSSRRSGNYDVFVMPIDGGEPRQITFHSSGEIATDWSPDGTRLLFFSGRDPQPYGGDLYEIAVSGGTPRRLTFDGGRDGTYSPDGKSVVYTRGFNTIFQDDYKGSAAYDLYVIDVAGGTPRRLTATAYSELNPCFSADGKTVWYLAERKGVFNVGAIPAAGNEGKPGEGKFVTSWADESARRSTLAWDRKTLAFEKNGRLVTVDLTAPAITPTTLEIRVESDVRNSGSDMRTVTSGAEHVAVSPDGAQIAVALRGDIWILPAAGGDATRVTNGPATDDWPRWSPDGKKLAYFSDAKGNDDVYVVDVATKAVRQVTDNEADDNFEAWMPDGKRLVYTSQRSKNKDLWIVDLESGEERQLTKDGKDDDDAVVSSDGQWIAFDSSRGGAQAIYVMPVAGGEAQVRKVTSGTGFYQVPSFSPDGQMIAYEEMDPASNSSGGIWVTKVGGGPSVQVSRDGQSVSWSPRGDWIYFHAERDGATDVYRVRAPSQIEVGERVPFIGRVSVDRRREFGDLFDEAWTKLKEGFYDPNMHGVDWKALKEKYRPMAVDAEIKDEFYNIVGQMLGELKASHLGIYPGGTDDEGDAVHGSAPTGYLGFDLDAATLDGGGRKITSIQTKGPADDAGLRVGDVVKSVAGAALKADTDLDKVLAGTAGKDVVVVYGKGDGSGDRNATLKATGVGQLAGLKYQLWLERCKKTVAEKAKGEVAYIHLAGMMPPDLAKFNQALAEINQSRKAKALVLDVRNNGGGNIHQQILQALAAKPFVAFQPRGFPKQIQPQLHWGKPIVLLINERSFSDAEVFPYGFKELKLGKVVGVPTAGGVIGTNDITLSDGSKFRVARVGWFGLNGENLEHLGVKPDVLVEETTEDRLVGRDPQLEKALEIVLAELHPTAAKPADKPAEKPADKPVPDAPKPAPEAPKPAPETPKPSPQTPPPAPDASKPAVAPTEKPAEKPADKPADKPAAAPTEKPVEKPVEKPAEKPADKPADGPKATEPKAGATLANPLADAKKGEWVRVKVQNRGQEQTLVITVTDVTDDQVEVETASEAGGPSNRRLESKSKELDLGSATREGADRQETVTVNGIVLHCTVVTLKNRRGETEERWYTNEIPVRGLFKRQIGDRVVSEVIEWGTEPKKP